MTELESRQLGEQAVEDAPLAGKCRIVNADRQGLALSIGNQIGVADQKLADQGASLGFDLKTSLAPQLAQEADKLGFCTIANHLDGVAKALAQRLELGRSLVLGEILDLDVLGHLPPLCQQIVPLNDTSMDLVDDLALLVDGFVIGITGRQGEG